MELTNYGQIRTMQIPEGWTKQGPPDEFTSMISYHDPEDSDVKISFHYRGKPVDATTAKDLQSILKQEPHTLSSKEIENIEIVMHNASEPEYFDLQSAHTENINGKTVLIVKGIWKLSDAKSISIYSQSSKDERSIDEIYFLAPSRKFAAHLSLFNACLNSIYWSDLLVQN